MMIHERKNGLVFSTLVFGAVGLLSLVVTTSLAHSANAPTGGEVMVYTTADESSPLLESVREGAVLSPMVEMTGAGGEKWFMVKTPSGNVGWIKAGDHAQARAVDEHFRAQPRDTGMIGPVTSSPEITGNALAGGVVTIPVRMYGNMIVAPVTITNGNSSVTGNLLVDTGASQTMLSKRLATELRLYAHDSQARYGIGGSVRVEVGVVDSVRIGRAEARNMRVSIHDFSPDPRYEGLLGFDFLRRFQMSVDAAKRILVLTPHKQ